jgi:hypothetical protein
MRNEERALLIAVAHAIRALLVRSQRAAWVADPYTAELDEALRPFAPTLGELEDAIPPLD